MASRMQRRLGPTPIRPATRGMTAGEFFAFAFLMLFVLGGTVLAFGLWRYGGPEGLIERVRFEIAVQRAARRTHPEFVPTPLAVASGSEVVIAISSPTATPPAVPGAVGQPSATDAPTAEPTATLMPAYAPAASFVALSGLRHAWQTWNNCGPATLAMNLSYYGSPLDQAQVGDTLRPNKDDKNVSPEELLAYAQSQGYHALLRVNGDVERLRLLLSNGIPVLIETWYEAEPNNGLGHYRLLTGYSDADQEWIAYDSYERPKRETPTYEGIRLPYGDFDHLWQVFNRTYLVVYDDSKAAVVYDIMGAEMDANAALQRALGAAHTEVQHDPTNAFAWFNLGSNLAALGDFQQAAAAFDQARVAGLPWRMLWYQFAPLQTYYEVERYDEVIALADATLQSSGGIEEVLYWKGRALAAQGNGDGARQAWQSAVQMNANYTPPQEALAQLNGR